RSSRASGETLHLLRNVFSSFHCLSPASGSVSFSRHALAWPTYCVSLSGTKASPLLAASPAPASSDFDDPWEGVSVGFPGAGWPAAVPSPAVCVELVPLLAFLSAKPLRPSVCPGCSSSIFLSGDGKVSSAV